MKHRLTLIIPGLIAISLISCARPAQPISAAAVSASPIVSPTSTTSVTPTVTAARSMSIQLEPCAIGSASARSI
jgi:hypothetical protein